MKINDQVFFLFEPFDDSELVNHAINHGTQHEMDRCRNKFPASFQKDFNFDQFLSNDSEEVVL